MIGNKANVSPAVLFKQYLRWLPVQLGLFNKGAYLLQIDRITPDDLFLASFPKSGNTWLRFLIANMKSKGEEINFSTIDQYVPDVYSAKEILNRQSGKRIIKTHHALFEHYPKTIYIYRDYRDVLVSYFYYETALGNFKGNISEFIRSKNVVYPFGHWKQHVKQALEFKQAHPDKMLVLSYEALSENPNDHIRSISEFCGLKTHLTIEEISQRCEFNRMKESESVHKSDFKQKSNKDFFRAGKHGNWQNELNEKCIELLKSDQGLNELMKQLGYDLNKG